VSGLLGEVEQAQADHRIGGVCGIRRVLETLPPAEADELRAILAEPASKYMHSTISRVLRARQIEVSDQTISRHRGGICRCPR
jgi:hypothetical protein